METTHYRPWLCASCGYVQDAATAVSGDAVPSEGDISICLNCGAPQMLDGGAWRPLRPDDWRGFTAGERRDLTEAMRIHRLAKPKIGELTKDEHGGRA